MKSVTQLRSLGDVKTIISTHSRSTPHLQGSTYLEVYLLDKERQRLETELFMLAKRQHRIEVRLKELQEAKGTLLGKAEPEQSPSPDPSPPTAEAQPPPEPNCFPPHRWRRMTVEY